MNIFEAKTQIEQAVKIYLKKDEYGNYRIPVQKQRPVFLLGAPGIGKTAVMEQIAKELDIALVAYSMSHHTRQSALGLPYIETKEYGGMEYKASLYTMSEIIASVYDRMEKSGKTEGILFLDEINCVSETLGPSMLQFLQYKTFGNHRVPDGWVIVTAGNPPEYNRSVREFDVATMDRLKVMEVEPDYETWKRYALQSGIHKAILTYLDIKKEDFYQIENTVDGRTYVTARGWEDLSQAIGLYEENGFAVDETLVGQYLRSSRIAGEFSAYYELYHKYREDYQVRKILEGESNDMIEKRAARASLDERISLMGLFLEALQPMIRENVETRGNLKRLLPKLRALKTDCAGKSVDFVDHFLQEMIRAESEEMRRKQEANGLTENERRQSQYQIAFAAECQKELAYARPAAAEGAFGYIRTVYEQKVSGMQARTGQISEQLENLFAFVEKCFGDGNEMLILVTELTVNKESAAFLAENGCASYYKYNKKFFMYERNKELMDELEAMAQRAKEEEELEIGGF